MKILDIILESEKTLTPRDLIKHGPDRLNTLVQMIKNGTPLFKIDGTPVVIKKSEADRILNLYNTNQFRGSISLSDEFGEQFPLSSFLKTKEFGGKSVAPNQNSDDVAVANIRPSHVLKHTDIPKGQNLTVDLAIKNGGFPGSQLGKKIIASEFLESQGRVGLAVKQIAKEIDSGKVPTIPNLTKGEINNIQNYGFEYLGLQQLIVGTADFPNIKEFYKHVGVDLRNLVVYFPQSQGNPLVDSYALMNKGTGNSIGISSKGAKGGAPSSITGLKIPDHMKKLIGKDPAITFINLIQTTTSWKQPFVAVNYISKNFPGNLGNLEQFLPFDDTFFSWCEDIWNRQATGVPKTLDEIPEPYKKLFNLVDMSISKRVNTPLFYDVRYYVKDVLHTAIRRNAIPQFNERMLEFLGENFIVLKTEQVGKPGVGKFITHVQWPSKMGGIVTFEHKDIASKWKSSLTWKLS